LIFENGKKIQLNHVSQNIYWSHRLETRLKWLFISISDKFQYPLQVTLRWVHCIFTFGKRCAGYYIKKKRSSYSDWCREIHLSSIMQIDNLQAAKKVKTLWSYRRVICIQPHHLWRDTESLHYCKYARITLHRLHMFGFVVEFTHISTVG